MQSRHPRSIGDEDNESEIMRQQECDAQTQSKPPGDQVLIHGKVQLKILECKTNYYTCDSSDALFKLRTLG